MNASPLRILITGATGCAGTSLSRLAIARGAVVHGIALSGEFVPGVAGRLGDVTQLDLVDAVIQEARPDWVFHLAALIPGLPSKPTPERYLEVNITGTYHVLDAVSRLAPQARVIVISSSAVYGQPKNPSRPITEEQILHPQSLYATTKVGEEMLAMQFFAQYGVHTIRARTFNQTGPREPEILVCATLAQQIARIETGKQEPILRAVTLATSRDFTDVRDVVAGYWAALEYGEAGQAYNICSGHSQSIRNIADILLALSTRRDIQIVETDPIPNPRAILDQIGDASRLRARSGWQPQIPIEKSLRDLLNEWRDKVETEK